MNFRETERHAQIMARRFDLASNAKRRELGAEAEQIIHRLRSQNYPVPRQLARIEAAVTAEKFEDLFDNMPV